MNRSELVPVFEAVGRIGGYLGVSDTNELLHISNRTASWVWKHGDVWEIWGSGDFLARRTRWLDCYLDHSRHWPAWCYVRPNPEAFTGLGCSTAVKRAMRRAKLAAFVSGLTIRLSTFDLHSHSHSRSHSLVNILLGFYICVGGTVVHQSMRMTDKPISTIVLAASHILRMYLNDNIYTLKKLEVVQPSHEHVTACFLIWALPLSEKLSLQLSNNKSKCILALLYARRSCIYNNMLLLSCCSWLTWR